MPWRERDCAKVRTAMPGEGIEEKLLRSLCLCGKKEKTMNPQQLNDDLAAKIDQARQSLVEIRNGHGGAGAGIIVHADGLIVTNAHVIGRRGLKAQLPDGRTLPARIIAYDRDHDLAALSIDADHLPAIEFGDSKNIQPGQWVTSIGHPWGVTGAATAGIVIGSGAEFPELQTGGREFVVASLHMRPGHSAAR